jgi:poly-gamma-glutamate system protein
MERMIKLSDRRLMLTFLVATLMWLLVKEYAQTQEAHPLVENMVAAERRTERAFAVVDSVKRHLALQFPEDSPVPWRALLGEDYTPMTTTLGSRIAKEVSTNPSWSAITLRLLSEAGVARGDTVAVIVSASFPALALSVLAAVNELEAEPLLISSLGASSYGANVRRATWLDIEMWVRDAGVMDITSVLVTAGGEEDAGIGLSDEGLNWIVEAADRSGVELRWFDSLAGAIESRMKLLAASGAKVVVNVGGGHASLGGCPHAAILPAGLWESGHGCQCDERGVLARASGLGLPVIHLLDIRRLAVRYGLDFEPGSRYRNSADVTTIVRIGGRWIVAALCAIIITMTLPWRRLS